MHTNSLLPHMGAPVMALLTNPITLLLMIQVASLAQAVFICRRSGNRQGFPLIAMGLLAVLWQALWTEGLQSLIELHGRPAQIMAAIGILLSVAAAGTFLSGMFALLQTSRCAQFNKDNVW